MRTERMGARQVDQFDTGVRQFKRANMPLNGHTGVVANPLAQARQAVEKRAFSGIGVTDDCDAGIGSPAGRNLVEWNAYFFGFSHRIRRVPR